MIYKYNIDKKFKIKWQKKIINWYKINKRDLPWRKSKNQNFYKIWISEVMLQQTVVKTVIPYYQKWLKTYPTLKSVAQAEQERLLKMWEGLGYYSRAKNLHQTSKILIKKYNGQIPQNFEELK